MSAAATVNLVTWSDADYAQTFRIRTDVDTYYNFTGCTLLMSVRKQASDVEVFLSLASVVGGILPAGSGIDIYEPAEDEGLTAFNIVITRDFLDTFPPGEYVQSLIVQRPDGIHDDLWRGSLIHSAGPTR